MGAGKSTIGKILAQKLDREFYDTDKMIEQSTQKTISEIFEFQDQNYFREREEETIKKITKELKNTVVALGGGSLLRDISWELVSCSGFTVYLKWKLDVLLKRLDRNESRPLIANTTQESDQDEILKLFESRKARYEEADFIIDCFEGLTVGQVADEIVTQLEKQK